MTIAPEIISIVTAAECFIGMLLFGYFARKGMTGAIYLCLFFAAWWATSVEDYLIETDFMKTSIEWMFWAAALYISAPAFIAAHGHETRTGKPFRWRGLHLLHLIPGSLAFATTLGFHTLPEAQRVAILYDAEAPLSQHGTWVSEAIGGLYLIFLLHYGLVFLTALLRRGQTDPGLEGYFSDLRPARQQWVLILFAYLLYSLSGGAIITYMPGGDMITASAILTIIESGFLPILLLLGVRYSFTYLLMRARAEQQTQEQPKSQKQPARMQKYAKSGLNEAEVQALADQLKAAMEKDELFLHESLTLGEVASHLDVPVWKLSQTLSQVFDVNFYSFINGYRVAEAQRLLREDAKTPVLNIGYAAGFRSKSTFNDAFQRLTGQTPTQYRRQLASKAA